MREDSGHNQHINCTSTENTVAAGDVLDTCLAYKATKIKVHSDFSKNESGLDTRY